MRTKNNYEIRIYWQPCMGPIDNLKSGVVMDLSLWGKRKPEPITIPIPHSVRQELSIVVREMVSSAERETVEPKNTRYDLKGMRRLTRGILRMLETKDGPEEHYSFKDRKRHTYPKKGNQVPTR